MTRWAERFRAPLPDWIQGIKNEVEEKVSHCRITSACKTGNPKFIKEFLICYWRFVDIFPEIIFRGSFRLLRREFLENLSMEKVKDFIIIGADVLNEIRGDETSHRELWLKTAEALGLSYQDLQRPPYEEVLAIGEYVGENIGPYIMFLRFVAVEMVAEAISKLLLESVQFKDSVGRFGQEWFEVHVTHEMGMTHEELAFHLAFAFYPGEITKSGVNSVIQPVVDLFVKAGNKAHDSVQQ